MLIREHQLHPDLTPFVQLIWTGETDGPMPNPPRERIVPDGIVELVFHFGDPFLTHHSNGSAVIQPRSFAISQMRHYIEIQPNGRVGLIAARFFPWGARHFFGIPIKEFLDQTIPTGELWYRCARAGELEEAIGLAADTDARVRLLQRFLLKKLARHHRAGSMVDGVIRYIRETEGRLSVDELCARTGFTQRHLSRKCGESVGTSPKSFSRVTRFLNLCHHVRTARHRTLTQLTYECGYYDQAHLIREFREFSGLTPGDFFRYENEISFADI